MNLLTTILLALGVLTAIAILFLLLTAYFTISAIQSRLSQFFTSDSDEKPSEFALVTDNVAQAFSARIVQGISAMVAGFQSGQSKQDKAQAIAEMSNANPALAGALSFMPKLKKLNPALLMFASQILSGLVNKTATPDNETKSEQPKFKF